MVPTNIVLILLISSENLISINGIIVYFINAASFLSIFNKKYLIIYYFRNTIIDDNIIILKY